MRRGFGFHDRRSPFRFNPVTLFLGGTVKGALYDLSSIATLFQDDAGNTPVTAVEQTVGRILDLSGNNNHAAQSASGSRPTYRALYNLFTNTEQFQNWNLSLVTINQDVIVAPDGTLTADKIVETTSTGGHSVWQSVTVVSGETYTMSCYFQKAERNFGWLKFSDGATNWAQAFDLATGQVGNVVFNAPTTSTIADAGNGWWRCTITVTAGNTGMGGHDVGVMETNGTRVYAGDAAKGIALVGGGATGIDDGSGAAFTGVGLTGGVVNVAGLVVGDGGGCGRCGHC